MVVSAIPVVGTGEVGYQPVVLDPHLGVLLEVTPQVLDEKNVLLDLHSTVPHPGSPRPPRRINTVGGAENVGVEIDQLNIAAQQFETTLRLRAGQPILVGGINAPTTDDEPDSGRGLYLVVQVQVH
jgi:type II secretory pathway component GspD/PulD (secretin)